MGDVDRSDTLAHYERLAAGYDDNWAYSDAFLDWMTRSIIETAQVTDADRIVDLGCGTGLYARRLLDAVEPREPITCADPSAPMLDQLPQHPGLRPLQTSAEDLAAHRGTATLSEPVDVILMKESVHHIPAADRTATLAGLAALLRPGGRILVVMLPTTLGYPLFPAALRRFEELQPDPVHIEGFLAAAGLATQLTNLDFELAIPKERYLSMVRSRYMSLLSTFTDDEIETGIAVIDRAHPEPVLRFTDRFAFVLGRREGGTS